MEYPYDRLFLPQEQLRGFCDKAETPFFLYDADTICGRAQAIQSAFSFCRYRLSFPVRTLPNPQILSLLRQRGVGAVCSNTVELALAKRAGYEPEEITFLAHHADALPNHGEHLILEHPAQLSLLPQQLNGAIIGIRLNPELDVRLYEVLSLRNTRQQFGAAEKQVQHMAEQLMARGCGAVGLHCQLGTNRMERDYYAVQAEALFRMAGCLQSRGIPVAYCDLGGGLGWSSRPQIEAPGIEKIASGVRRRYEEILVPAGLNNMELRSQIGRYLAAPAGIFVSRVVDVRQSRNQMIGLDASSSDLMRHMIYKTYFHVSVLGKHDTADREISTVSGWLQETGDRFAENVMLPRTEVGDYCVLHGTGAYGQAISSAYGGNLRCAEYLLENGEIRMIRRAETLDDYVATLIP